MSLQSSGHRERTFQSSTPRPFAVGLLQQKDVLGKIVASHNIHPQNAVIIGRDKSQCQYVIDDPCISKKHLRIYTVVYDNDDATEVGTLVYAEDLSRNGVYWNASLIGRGNGGVLLSEDDILRLSPNTFIEFKPSRTGEQIAHFDLTQEQEMTYFRNDYVLTDRLLGVGAFGRVFMAITQRARKQLACKMVDLRKLRPEPKARIGRAEQPAAAEAVDSRVQIRKVKGWIDERKRNKKLEERLSIYYREVEILASISHPNIVGLEKVFVTDNTLYIFQDLVTAGDLFSHLESKDGKLSEVEAAAIIRQILIALSFLHDRNIVHRDLKPDNILMTSSSAGARVILTDFGAARRIQHQRHRMLTMAGTDEYAAPEVLGRRAVSGDRRRTGYTKSVDMWSLGCVAVVLLTGGSAFNDPTTHTYSERLASECNLGFLRKSPEWGQVRRRPQDFVENLLLVDEDARMTTHQALEHSWFSNENHKTNFRELYERSIRHWRPRLPKTPIIEFFESDVIKHLPCSQLVANPSRRSQEQDRGRVPVDPPYKPFPRKMYSPLWPKRKPGSQYLTEAVNKAIEQNWTQKVKDSKIAVSNGRINFTRRDNSIEGIQASLPGTADQAARCIKSLRPTAGPVSPLKFLLPSSKPVGGQPTAGSPTPETTTPVTPVSSVHMALPSAPKQGQKGSKLFQNIVLPRPRSSTVDNDSEPSKPLHLEAANEAPARSISSGKRSDGPTHTSSTILSNVKKSITQKRGSNAMEGVGVQTCDEIQGAGIPGRRSITPLLMFGKQKRCPPSSRARVKRRRGSIFDIEEDGDSIEEDDARVQSAKRQKVSAQPQQDVSGRKVNEYSSDDTEVVPHHVSAIVDHDSGSENQGLYLPR